MKREIKVHLLSAPIGTILHWFDDNIFLKLLRDKYDVKLVGENEKFDILLWSLYKNHHMQFKNCIKMFWTEEPGFWSKNQLDTFYPKGDRFGDSARDADIIMTTFYHNTKNNLRFPSYLVYYYDMLMDGMLDKFSDFFNERIIKDRSLAKRKFCVFMHRSKTSSRNGELLFRSKFLEKLNKYKLVDDVSIGGGVREKINFVKQYKFCFSMENTNGSPLYFPSNKDTGNLHDIGYTSEKIVQSFVSKSVPLYWGNQFIHKDINTNMFINWHDFNDDDAMIDKIIELDNDDDKYVEYLNGTIFNKTFVLGIFKEFWDMVDASLEAKNE